ncbi:hypothetical protein BN1095_3710001 [Clostridioides difficile]|uniref:Uncharacterized protein n=1 Tax=Clostridioides difficile TaxID=1496 RepID=A0A069ATK6_CLODI|nr:hypothetical protein BN1095_3710001 [Clostridioides difficile]
MINDKYNCHMGYGINIYISFALYNCFIPIQLYLENIKKKKFKSRIIDILKNNHNNLDLNDINK